MGRLEAHQRAVPRVRDGRGEGCITLTWADAAEARKAPKLKGDPRSLWKGRTPDKPPVTEPVLYAVARDGRLFRGDLPPAGELMPFVVAVDGNDEDGFGGYVLHVQGGADGWSFSRSGDTLTVTGRDPSAITFDGTWLAGLQAIARARPELFPHEEGVSADLWVTVVSEWVQDDGKVFPGTGFVLEGANFAGVAVKITYQIAGQPSDVDVNSEDMTVTDTSVTIDAASPALQEAIQATGTLTFTVTTSAGSDTYNAVVME